MVSPSGTAALISPPARVGLDVVLAWCKGGAGGKVTRGRPHTLLDPPTGERCLRRGRRSRIGVAACRHIGCLAPRERLAVTILGWRLGQRGGQVDKHGKRTAPSGCKTEPGGTYERPRHVGVTVF